MLNRDIQWMMMGDFNMIESQQDQVGGRPNGISGKEQGAFENY